MLAVSLTAAVFGVDARIVRVEADTAAGFPKFTVVGLPDSAVKESEGRIRAALRNCGYPFRWDRRITVNMAPASLRKIGSSFDLATALGLLAADGIVPADPLATVLLVGELALDGSLRAVGGVLPMVLAGRSAGVRDVILPAENAPEAALVEDVRVFPVTRLLDAVDLAASPTRPDPPPRPVPPPRAFVGPDLSDVRGQPLAKRALEIAAAGGHNLLLVGPPGTGKSMLAGRLTSLLPPLSSAEALETTAIHSVCGAPIRGVLQERPFRSPHHTTSEVALVGGGSFPRPGEASLAHNGVLFLDELPEFSRRSLEALRQPLEEAVVHVARARGRLDLPARFQLVAAMNPCPCGFRGSTLRSCRCTPARASDYLRRLSGPLLDRIDLVAELRDVGFDELHGPPGESSATVRARVMAAHARRVSRASVASKAEGTAARARAAEAPIAKTIANAARRLPLTARGHDRLLRVARTIADLDGAPLIAERHFLEAIQFSCGRGDTGGLGRMQDFSTTFC